MADVSLILGTYSSQPIDLASPDIESIYERSYKPFLKLLYEFSDLPFTLYYAGSIVDWLERTHSEFVDVLSEMVKRRQVEVLGGAYFEPLLPLIPKTDRIGQLERMTTQVRKSFGRRPRGAWIPGGVWEQRIASSLKSGGIEYAFLKDRQSDFDVAGEFPRPILTEDQGKNVMIFLVPRELTARLFIDEPTTVIEHLIEMRDRWRASVASSQPPVVALMFDATLHAYRDGARSLEWYRRFLELVQRQDDWLDVQLPNRILRNRQNGAIRYAAATTLDGLLSWQETIEGARAYHRRPGRGFRSLLELYPESARLYAKMQHTHLLVNQIRGDKYRKLTAREALWRGQSHFAYWLNRSGGIYRSSLRKATYAALIEAEKYTRERGIFAPAITRMDVDLDGQAEVVYQGNALNAYVHRRGAMLFELDYTERNWNYLDTFQRQPEVFHDESTADAGYDDWPRAGFVDHLLEHNHTMADFSRGIRHQICDIAKTAYEVESYEKDRGRVVFAAEAADRSGLCLLSIRKTYTFADNRIDVTYELRNLGTESIQAQFCCEINLSFHSLDPGRLRLAVRQGRSRSELRPDPVEEQAVSDLNFHDLHSATSITLVPTERPNLWCFPVAAVGVLGNEPHRFYQSNCAVFRWPLTLGPSDTFSATVSLRVGRA